jgi:hypothetical protein
LNIESSALFKAQALVVGEIQASRFRGSMRANHLLRTLSVSSCAGSTIVINVTKQSTEQMAKKAKT